MCAEQDWCHLLVAGSAGARGEGVRAAADTFAGLDLEKPDGDVDGDAQRTAGAFEGVGCEFGEGDAAAGPNLRIDSAGNNPSVSQSVSQSASQ